MRRTYRAVAAAALLVLLTPAAAQAGPEHDAAELSQTIEVAWLMPGPFQGWATWPQTYLPDGVPACGEGAVQVDTYKYGTQEMRDRVAALVATGVLRSPADDSRISTGRYRFVELEPCEPVGPGEPQNPGEPSIPSTPTDRPGTGAAPQALPARAVVVLPSYAG